MQISAKIMEFGTIAIISTILCCGIIRSAHGNYVCDFYDCGNGICKDSSVYPFFRCECKHGWRRPHVDNRALSYLPCVIPNCKLNSACSDALYPSTTSEVHRGNLSYSERFSPCDWDVSGAGTCVKKPHGSHTCLCHQGYQNLMNSTIGYCVTECELGADCAAEGVTIAGTSSKTVKPAASGTNFQALDSRLATGSTTSDCARLARDYAWPLIAKLFIISVIVFFVR
uniref:EGF-like domain-containing protein n=1 Tax=Picea sitchensis TaxID=3332 RepID=A9P2K1_PICSI|nr:unknown [Picea sitchensis]